jgi:hypothetical protein
MFLEAIVNGVKNILFATDWRFDWLAKKGCKSKGLFPCKIVDIAAAIVENRREIPWICNDISCGKVCNQGY